MEILKVLHVSSVDCEKRILQGFQWEARAENHALTLAGMPVVMVWEGRHKLGAL